ncbi:MAG: pyridoxamine 5'-phosphate oxidase family protein, partial [Anaerolineales bacterium]
SLAKFGRQRFASEVAFLATIRKDGSPRVHPVTPILGENRLFIFMEPTSPKGHDLRRDGRYALHCSVADSGGGEGEFFGSGTAKPIVDQASREIAITSAGFEVAERYVLFELEVDAAFSTVYAEGGEPIRDRLKREASYTILIGS